MPIHEIEFKIIIKYGQHLLRQTINTFAFIIWGAFPLLLDTQSNLVHYTNAICGNVYGVKDTGHLSKMVPYT